MFSLRTIARLGLIYRSSVRTLCANPAVQSVDKEALKQLRKETGYSYVNCRKALLQFGPDHLAEAIKWLKEKALKEGWEKAAKVGHKLSKEGLVCVLVDSNKAAIVEVNCETDFVARNDQFKRFIQQVAQTVVSSISTNAVQTGKFEVISHNLESLKSTESGANIDDLFARTIGKLGENLVLSKAQVLVAPADVELFGYAHPRDDSGEISAGKYAAVVGLTRSSDATFPSKTLGHQLCQHIIGMRTESLGTPPPSGEQKSPSKGNCEINNEQMEQKEEEKEEDLNAFYTGEVTEIDESETALLRQSFMLHPSQTVYEYVTEHQANIVDFYRAELGA